jgi:hypothetical protein
MLCLGVGVEWGSGWGGWGLEWVGGRGCGKGWGWGCVGRGGCCALIGCFTCLGRVEAMRFYGQMPPVLRQLQKQAAGTGSFQATAFLEVCIVGAERGWGEVCVRGGWLCGWVQLCSHVSTQHLCVILSGVFMWSASKQTLAQPTSWSASTEL